MKLSGSTEINAKKQAVWTFLTDANAVGSCVPGLEEMDIIEPEKLFKATANIGFGTVSVRFITEVEWLELDEPDSATMKAHGDGPGSAADVWAKMDLNEGDNGKTLLNWEADVTVVGTIASLASRLLPSVSNILTSMFFNCVQKHIQSM